MDTNQFIFFNFEYLQRRNEQSFIIFEHSTRFSLVNTKHKFRTSINIL